MKNKKLYIIILLVLLLVIMYFVYQNYEVQHNSTTVQLIILDKIQDENEYLIHVITNDESKREGDLIIKDKQIWDLLKIGEKYFAIVSWESLVEPSALFSNKTFVERIELMN